MMAKNDYWKKRLEETAKIQADNADKIETELRVQYKKSIKSLSERIELFYARYAKTNDINMAEARRLLDKSELKGFKMSLDEFRDKALDNADGQWTALLDSEYIKSRVSRLEALKCNIRGEVELLKQKQEQAFRTLMTDTYKDTFYRNIFEYSRGIGFEIDFTGLNRKAIEQAVYTKWFDGNNFSDRIWKDKRKLLRELNTNITQGIIRGDSPDRMITSLSKRMNVSRNYAAALLQTESAHIANEAAFDTYKTIGVEEYEVIETLDKSTCGSCQDMDGRHFPVSQKEPGVNCPPFHTGCRGFIIPYFDDEFTISEKCAARDENGKTYYADGNMSYEEWHENVDNAEESGIIKLRRNIRRRENNMGVFQNLEIPMQKRSVLKIAKRYSISTDGLTFKIQRSEKLLALPFYGSTDYNNVGRIDLFPNAFVNEEQMVRTIIHEKCHVKQLQKYGKVYTQQNIALMEKQAERFENLYYKILRKKVK